jgi:hypothetical protein
VTVASMSARVTLAPVLACPVCGTVALHTDLRAWSTGWGECYAGRGANGHRRAYSCPGQWFAVALPPRATGATLAAMVGACEARALLAALARWPGERDGTDDDLGAVPLDARERLDADDRGPSYLIVSARGRDRHHFRHQPVRAILRALGILEEAA